MKTLLKYDLFYLSRTKKFLVFLAVFVIFSIISPLTAKYLNEILSFLLSGEDLGIPLPDPTVFTAYEQYISDLYETIFFVVLFVSVSIFIRDKTKGLLPLVFSKPVDRTKYILSKYVTFLVLLIVSIIMGYLVFTYYTYVLFDKIFFVEGLQMMALYFLYLAFMSSVALFFASVFRSYLIAVLCTFGVYIFFTILTIGGQAPVLEHLPGMLINTIVGVLYNVNDVSDVVLNITYTVVLTGLFIAGSIWMIRQQDVIE